MYCTNYTVRTMNSNTNIQCHFSEKSPIKIETFNKNNNGYMVSILVAKPLVSNSNGTQSQALVKWRNYIWYFLGRGTFETYSLLILSKCTIRHEKFSRNSSPEKMFYLWLVLPVHNDKYKKKQRTKVQGNGHPSAFPVVREMTTTKKGVWKKERRNQ